MHLRSCRAAQYALSSTHTDTCTSAIYHHRDCTLRPAHTPATHCPSRCKWHMTHTSATHRSDGCTWRVTHTLRVSPPPNIPAPAICLANLSCPFSSPQTTTAPLSVHKKSTVHSRSPAPPPSTASKSWFLRASPPRATRSYSPRSLEAPAPSRQQAVAVRVPSLRLRLRPASSTHCSATITLHQAGAFRNRHSRHRGHSLRFISSSSLCFHFPLSLSAPRPRPYDFRPHMHVCPLFRQRSPSFLTSPSFHRAELSQRHRPSPHSLTCRQTCKCFIKESAFCAVSFLKRFASKRFPPSSLSLHHNLMPPIFPSSGMFALHDAALSACSICLKLMDEAVFALATTFCSHTMHAACLVQ